MLQVSLTVKHGWTPDTEEVKAAAKEAKKLEAIIYKLIRPEKGQNFPKHITNLLYFMLSILIHFFIYLLNSTCLYKIMLEFY